ncbi:sulfuric ester hydrolase [Aureococcus anophagefferens]|nr:sulfuric ester hydrolase [Aureococcus anophagefferens]
MGDSYASSESSEDGAWEVRPLFSGDAPSTPPPAEAPCAFPTTLLRRPSLRFAAALAVAAAIGLAARRRAPGGGPASTALAGAARREAASRTMPHVLHVVLDDVGWDDLWESRDLPPAVVSPTIFRLAKEGVKLTSYYGQSYCTPARAALLTGKFVHRLGFASPEADYWGPLEVVGDANYSVPLGHELLPAHLRNLGYATHGVGKWNVGHCATEYLPWKRGFDTFLGYFSDGIHYTTHAVDEYGGGVISADDDAVDEAHTLADLVYYDGDDASFRWDRGLDFLGEHTTAVFAREALRRLRGGGDAAKYVWLAFHGAHDNEGSLEGVDVDDDAFDGLAETLTAGRLAFAKNLRFMDDAIFGLKRALLDSGRDFLVAVHSDNGGFPCARYLGGSNAPLRGAKFDFMEGALRLPALLYSPTLLSTVARGRAYNHLFHHVDWLATFLSAATATAAPEVAAKLGPGYDSVDHMGAINDAQVTGPRTRAPARILFSVSATGLVVRDGDYKLIREYGDSGWFEPDLDASGFSREDAKRERASSALRDVAARLAAYGDDAYRDEFFHFPLERAWIFHELDDEEAARLRATWIDTSDDDVYRFIAPWGCMLVFDDGSTAPGGAGVRLEDTRGPG